MDTGIQSLPYQPTSFIGRQSEIAELTKLLRHDACRLVTLTGPGGIGKTRLGIEIARCKMNDFVDGVYFVPLAPLTSAENIVPAVAHVLGFQFHASTPPRQQLLDYLSDHHLLLILDNFEHVLDGVDLIVDMLNAASALKILVTSREVLNLQEEWARTVKGMPFPEVDAMLDAESDSALQLFADRARRASGDFSLADEHASVIRICQLVEGMPLALELAASWRNVMPCAAIADRLDTGIDFLATKLRNVETRHHSIQAVFDQSWALLSKEEKESCASLSVFHGGFTAEAAEAVAGASLNVLTRLVDKSFIQVGSTGRYDIHELLRQYAAGQLALTPKAKQRCVDQHCNYYATFLNERVPHIASGDSGEVLVEIENLRSAWDWAIQQRHLSAISAMVEGLVWLYESQCLIDEGRLSFEHASNALTMTDPVGEQGIALGQVLAARGAFTVQGGQVLEGHALIHEAISILRHLNALPSVMAWVLTFGDYPFELEYGRRMLEESIAISRKIKSQWRVARGLYVLGFNYYSWGRYDEAIPYFKEATTIEHTLDNLPGVASNLMKLGQIGIRSGNFTQARHNLEEALSLYGESFPSRRARCMWELGLLAWQQEQNDEAERWYQDCLTATGAIGDKTLSAIGLSGLALLTAENGNLEAAQEMAENCLGIMQEIGTYQGTSGTLLILGYLAAERDDLDGAGSYYAKVLKMMATSVDETYPAGDQARHHFGGARALTLEAILGIANLEAKSGDLLRAVELLALGFASPWDTAGGQERKPLYWQLRDDLEAELDSAIFQAAWARGEKLNLEATVNQLLAQFSPQDTNATHKANQALDEPLTGRELEVLELLAEGLTNAQIAEALVIAVGTVKRYVYTICQKLRADNRTQAVINAQRLNLL